MSKSDRRKWNKSNNRLNLDYPDPDVTAAANKKRYDDYLLNLQLNNQITKVLNEKDDKVKELEQREGGFSLYVNGAHKLPERHTPRHIISTSRQKPKNDLKAINFVPKLHFRKDSAFTTIKSENDLNRCKSEQTNRRKQWNNSSVIIKTMDGLNIRISAPKKCQTERDPQSNSSIQTSNYYSDDFESESTSDDNFTFNNKDNSATATAATTTTNDLKLIKSVKFSDASSISSDNELKPVNATNESKKKKHACLRLSRNDVKFLRESINKFHISSKLSDDSLEDDEIEEKLEADHDTNKNMVFGKDKNNQKTNNKKSNSQNESLPSGNCALILKHVEKLDPKEKKALLGFLTKIDDLNEDIESN